MKKVVVFLVLAALVATGVFAQSGRKIAFKPYGSLKNKPTIERVEETRTGARVTYKNTTGEDLGWLWMAVRVFYPDGTDEYDTAKIKIGKGSSSVWKDFKFQKPSEIQSMNVSVSDKEPDNIKR